jgi:hypothetical protein
MESKIKFKDGLKLLPIILLGGCLGGGGGWLIGCAMYFLLAEWPNRNLPPEQFTARTCGLNLSIGMLTFLVLIPSGVITGAIFSVKFSELR